MADAGAGREPSARQAARRREAAALADEERCYAEAAAEAAARAAAERAAAPPKQKKEKQPEVPDSVLRAPEGPFSGNKHALAWPDTAQAEEMSGMHTRYVIKTSI